jgi:multisubunit Na+/H+ antiporter MnhB subunit
LVKDTAPLIEGMGALNYVNFGITAGKLMGAVLMLKKKLNGLYTYTVAAILGFITMMYSLSLTWKYLESIDGGGTIMIFTTVFAVMIAIGFIVMYWLPVNRKLLS